jgi:hypothetical protein
LEVDVQQANFKILQLLPQFLIFFLVENGFFQVGQKLQKLVKKTEGILGINPTRTGLLNHQTSKISIIQFG